MVYSLICHLDPLSPHFIKHSGIFNLWTLHQHNKTTLIDHIKTKINEDVESYLANIDYELNNRREDNPRLFSSNHSPIPVMTNLLVPVRYKVGNLNINTTRLVTALLV